MDRRRDSTVSSIRSRGMDSSRACSISKVAISRAARRRREGTIRMIGGRVVVVAGVGV